MTQYLSPTPTDVIAAVENAITVGLPRPTVVLARDDADVPFIHLGFGWNDTADLDRWANHVGAQVGHDDYTYGQTDDMDRWVGAPCHMYGTAADGSVYGSWLGRRVLLSCEVLGPHPANR